MGPFQAFFEVVSSVFSAVGDGIETVVDVITEVVEETVNAIIDFAVGVLDGAQEWMATNAWYPFTALANIVFGYIKGVLETAREMVAIHMDFFRNLGRLVAAILSLDLSTIIRAIVDMFINFAEAAVLLTRFIFHVPMIDATVGYYFRDHHRNFIKDLIEEEFDRDMAAAILKRLGWGSTHFALPLSVKVKLMAADSAVFPFRQMHQDGNLDMYTMAGLLSTDSLQVCQGRTRMTHVNNAGEDEWWRPVTRWDISHFLEGAPDAPRLRAYAMDQQAAGAAMRFAKKHFRDLFVDLRFDPTERYPMFQHFESQPCRNEEEFSFFDSDGTIDERRATHDGGIWFAENTDQDGSHAKDAEALALGVFGFRGGIHGRAYGRALYRSNGENSTCSPYDTTDRCISDIFRESSDHRIPNNTVLATTPTGCGCAWRDSYPPYFSKFVLAHELGHWFGLCHAGHDGIQHIMFSIKEYPWVVSIGSLSLILHGEPTFSKKDVGDTWRFIVKRLPHIL